MAELLAVHKGIRGHPGTGQQINLAVCLLVHGIEIILCEAPRADVEVCLDTLLLVGKVVMGVGERIIADIVLSVGGLMGLVLRGCQAVDAVAIQAGEGHCASARVISGEAAVDFLRPRILYHDLPAAVQLQFGGLRFDRLCGHEDPCQTGVLPGQLLQSQPAATFGQGASA